MGQDSDSETRQASSSSLTLDSLFDIKGPVRLVPQGASHKPHILLRRERLSKDADESPCFSGTTRFYFVANKRFTISKGHTLSLGIADPTLDDELKFLGSENSFVLEFDVCKKPQMVDNLSSLPARMRKSLTGTKTFDTFAQSQPPNSLGFPGYPLNIPETRVFASASVQTDPVAPVEIALSSSSRTPTFPKTHKQKSPSRLYPSPISADRHSLENIPAYTCQDDPDLDAPTERSFSSMDLSTPQGSLSNSPVICSPSRTDDILLIPGPPDPDHFSLPPAVPEAMNVALEDFRMCGVSSSAQAVKPKEIKLSQTEHNLCPIVPFPATTFLLKSKSLQPNNFSTFSPQATDASRVASIVATPPARISNPNSDANPGIIDAESRISPALTQRARVPIVPQTKPSLKPVLQPTISNPLGIRPSVNSLSKPLPRGPRLLYGGRNPTQAEPPQSTTPTLAPTGLVAPKKPVVVGAKWTALRGLMLSSSQANAPSATTAGSSSRTTAPALATTPNLSRLLRYSPSPPHGESASTIPSTGKRKLTAENDVLIQGSLLKRIRMENGDGDNKSQGHIRTNAEEQPSKTVKMENIEVASLSQTSSSLLQEGSGSALSLISRVENTTGDGGDSADGSAPKTKSQRRRERQKLSKKRKAELALRSQTLDAEDKEAVEADEKLKREEEKMKMEARAREEKEKSEKAAKLAQRKAETDKQKHAAVTPSPALPIQKQTSLSATPRFTHPLPPKPRITITASSYRPERKRDRSRSSSGDSLSRSRSQSREREPIQAREIGSPRRSRSSSRKRDPSVDRQQGDNQAKPSASTSNSNANGGVTQSKHTPNDARGPGTTQAAVNGNGGLPFTMPNREFELIGREGGRVAVQYLAFSSNGYILAVVCSDMTLRFWTTGAQAKEVSRCQALTPIVAIRWLQDEQDDIGVLVLSSNGSTDIWTRNQATFVWSRETLFNVPLSMSEKPISLAFGKDKIAISTTNSVKVWLLTPKGVWQIQREIKRSGVTALRFQTNGSGLFGGCRDGTVWYSEVPNGTLRAYAFLPSNKCITSIQLHPNGTQLLIGQKGGTAYLISHQGNENKGTLEKQYCAKVDDESKGTYAAIFATGGQAIVSGTSNGCALVWDRKKGNVVYGLKHGTGDAILAVAASDGNGQAGVAGMVTGTREGKLCWWPIPKAAIR